MKLLFIFSLVASFNIAASTIVIPIQNDEGRDFATTFKQKCVDGDMPSECQAHAAVLRADLTSVLALVEDSSHPDTVALFREISNSKDERLRSYGLKYLARNSSPDDEGLLQSALNAFLSTDYWLGRMAAKILSASKKEEYKELGRNFLSLQGDSHFDTQEGYSRVLADEFFQSITTFFDNAHFSNEERFIGMDLPLLKAEYNKGVLGGKGYIVPGSLASNAKEVERMTGIKPAPGLPELQERIQKIMQELTIIGQQMQRGDFSQMGRMTQLQAEMLPLTQAQTVWLSDLPFYSQMKNIVAFFKFNGSGSSAKLEGAILLKEWAFYEGTSIVYLGKW